MTLGSYKPPTREQQMTAFQIQMAQMAMSSVIVAIKIDALENVNQKDYAARVAALSFEIGEKMTQEAEFIGAFEIFR